MDVRLIGGSSVAEGRVEVYANGGWETVCDDGWDLNDAAVVCRMLGYPGAKSAPGSAMFGQGSGNILLDNVRCSGSEDSIFECQHSGIGAHNCGHQEDAGVVCNSVMGDTILIYLGNGFLGICLLLAGFSFIYKVYREGYRRQYRHRNFVWIGAALLLHLVVFTIFLVLPTIIKFQKTLGSGENAEQVFVLILFPITSLFFFLVEGIDLYWQSTKPVRQANNLCRAGLICILTSTMVSGCAAVATTFDTTANKSVTCGTYDQEEPPTFSPFVFYIPLSLIALVNVAILALANQSLTSNFVIRGRADMALSGKIRIVRQRIKSTATMFFITLICLIVWWPAFCFRASQQGFKGVFFVYVIVNFIQGIAIIMFFCSSENAVDFARDEPQGVSSMEDQSGTLPNQNGLTGDVPIQDHPPLTFPLDRNRIDRDPEDKVHHLHPEAPGRESSLSQGRNAPLGGPPDATSAVGGIVPLTQDAPAIVSGECSSGGVGLNNGQSVPTGKGKPTRSSLLPNGVTKNTPSVTHDAAAGSLNAISVMPNRVVKNGGTQNTLSTTQHVLTHDEVGHNGDSLHKVSPKKGKLEGAQKEETRISAPSPQSKQVLKPSSPDHLENIAQTIVEEISINSSPIEKDNGSVTSSSSW